MSRPVRRVLSRTASSPVAAIHLRRTLPHASSDLPGSSGGQPSNTSCLVLLRVGFTQPHRSPGALVVSYTTVSPLPPGGPGGGLFSVALSRGSPRVGVTHHPALWSPDVPRRGSPRDAAAWPTHPPPVYRASSRRRVVAGAHPAAALGRQDRSRPPPRGLAFRGRRQDEHGQLLPSGGHQSELQLSGHLVSRT